ncbi:hypothetical protein KJ564_15085, partial [bacterium]|nr:hypothetical protein [bacterium]MBU1881607.1 hypothetical protein [bacterium]
MRADFFAILVISLLISPLLCRGNPLYDAQFPISSKPESIVHLQNRQPYQDAWAAPDKFDHFFGSAMLSCSGFLALKVNHNDVDTALITSLGVTIGVGIAK